MDMFLKIFAQQLRSPSGIIGKYVSRWMNRSNVAINRAALELALKASTKAKYPKILEIGFGGGALITMAVDCGFFSNVSGVDSSPDMVRLVRRKFRNQIMQGNVTIEYGDIIDLPFKSDTFDVLVSNNTIYFWPSLEAAVSECLRVLSDDGFLVLGFDDKNEMLQWPGHRYGFTTYEIGDICTALNSLGFSVIEKVSGKTEGWGLFHCVLASKTQQSHPM